MSNRLSDSEIRMPIHRRRPKVQPFHTPPFPQKVLFLKILSLFVSLSVARFHRETTLRTPRELPDTAQTEKVRFVNIPNLYTLRPTPYTLRPTVYTLHQKIALKSDFYFHISKKRCTFAGVHVLKLAFGRIYIMERINKCQTKD